MRFFFENRRIQQLFANIVNFFIIIAFLFFLAMFSDYSLLGEYFLDYTLLGQKVVPEGVIVITIDMGDYDPLFFYFFFFIIIIFIIIIFIIIIFFIKNELKNDFFKDLAFFFTVIASLFFLAMFFICAPIAGEYFLDYFLLGDMVTSEGAVSNSLGGYDPRYLFYREKQSLSPAIRDFTDIANVQQSIVDFKSAITVKKFPWHFLDASEIKQAIAYIPIPKTVKVMDVSSVPNKIANIPNIPSVPNNIANIPNIPSVPNNIADLPITKIMKKAPFKDFMDASSVCNNIADLPIPKIINVPFKDFRDFMDASTVRDNIAHISSVHNIADLPSPKTLKVPSRDFLDITSPKNNIANTRPKTRIDEILSGLNNIVYIPSSTSIKYPRWYFDINSVQHNFKDIITAENMKIPSWHFMDVSGIDVSGIQHNIANIPIPESIEVPFRHHISHRRFDYLSSTLTLNHFVYAADMLPLMFLPDHDPSLIVDLQTYYNDVSYRRWAHISRGSNITTSYVNALENYTGKNADKYFKRRIELIDFYIKESERLKQIELCLEKDMVEFE
jgi:hypothetical protein